MAALAQPHWLGLATFAAGVLAVALYGLAASGHFPRAERRPGADAGPGSVLLWGTLALVAASAAVMLIASLWVLPWYLSVIAGGAALLFAPLILQPLPDSFVDGRGALLLFSAAAALLAGLMWAAA
jgi:hypothetical protein